MATEPDLKLIGTAYVDGRELLCAGCGNGFSLEIHKRGFREVWPAWISCLACGAGEDSAIVTNGLVDAVLDGHTTETQDGRQVFRAEWRGLVMTGEVRPLFDARQLVEAAKVVHEEFVAPEVKTRWKAAKKAAKTQAKRKARAVTGAVTDAAREKTDQAVGATKAAVLTAAWTLQTGGAGPADTPRPKRRRCTVKGCRGGMVTIATRIHSETGKTREIKVPCGVCHRSST